MQKQLDILDNISTGVIAFDETLHLRSINAAGEALLEVSSSRIKGKHASKLVENPEEWLGCLQQALSSNSPLTRRNLPITLNSGQEIHVDLVANPVNEAGEVHLIVELQTIDRLLRISREESIINAQETTRAVVRGLAHEIKNPLGGVRGAAQLLAKELPGSELTEYTEIIIREADRLRDLVDRLLGSHHQLELGEVNIHEVLEHVGRLILAESGNQMKLVRDYDPSIPEIRADKAQLLQAVLNIMRNALQAALTPRDCAVTLRTRSLRQFTIGAIRHRLVCRVDISDNGPGIPADILHAIFVPMVTGKAEGSGLGLSISQSIVNRHGGLVECASEPGKTTFTIYLPMESTHAKTK